MKSIKEKIGLCLMLLIFAKCLSGGEVNSWECGKFEDSKVIGEGGVYLGTLGPSWSSDSIFNSSSSYSSTWSNESIFNDTGSFGDTYSSTSVFNDGASNPPKIISDSEVVGYLSVGPSWDSDRYSPNDIKYTCDWD